MPGPDLEGLDALAEGWRVDPGVVRSKPAGWRRPTGSPRCVSCEFPFGTSFSICGSPIPGLSGGCSANIRCSAKLTCEHALPWPAHRFAIQHTSSGQGQSFRSVRQLDWTTYKRLPMSYTTPRSRSTFIP